MRLDSTTGFGLATPETANPIGRPTYISRVERGNINPAIIRLGKIADALESPFSDMVQRHGTSLPVWRR